MLCAPRPSTSSSVRCAICRARVGAALIASDELDGARDANEGVSEARVWRGMGMSSASASSTTRRPHHGDECASTVIDGAAGRALLAKRGAAIVPPGDIATVMLLWSCGRRHGRRRDCRRHGDARDLCTPRRRSKLGPYQRYHETATLTSSSAVSGPHKTHRRPIRIHSDRKKSAARLRAGRR